MPFPNYKNKHKEEALIHPEEWTSKYVKLKKGLPKKYIIIYFPYVLRHFMRKYRPEKIKINRLITVYKHKNVGVVRMTGIGSPNAVTSIEELIALGGKEFINTGAAGGLENFGVFLCNRAIKDEGTSYHYLPGKFSYPDKKLSNELKKAIERKGINLQIGTTWTIDAPYRETKKEIKHYRKMGVVTVEMEASALFTVAKFRKVKIASAFVVSDLLADDKWDPQFHAKGMRRELNRVFDASIDCLSGSTSK